MGKKSKVIPKKVAGYKVPKKLRKSKVLRGLLDNAMGREVLASALVAGAGAAAKALAHNWDDQSHKSGSGKGSVGAVSHALHDGAGAIMQVVAGAARSVLPEPVAPAAPGKPSKGALSEPRMDKPGPDKPTPEDPRH